MKKTLLTLCLMLILSSCATNDIISEQNENLTSLQSSKAISSSDQNKTTNKNFDQLVMDLSFTDGVKNDNGGCTFEYLAGGSFDSPTVTSTACFGPNPIYQNNYLVRGYGKPRRPLFGEQHQGVLLEAKNKEKTIINQGRTELANDEISNAISVEFAFESNTTYQIILTTDIRDDIYVTKNDVYNGNDDQYSIDQSEAFPTIAVELKSTPDIVGNDPCSDHPIVSTSFNSGPNYFKKQKAEINNRYKEGKEFVYNFSTLESKNGIIIYFIPELVERNPTSVPRSVFTMDLKKIKIIKKAFFDPSFVISSPLDPERNTTCSRCP